MGEPERTLRQATRAPKPLKAIGNGIADLLALPFVLCYHAQAALLRRRRNEVFQTFSHLLGMWPGFLGKYVRRAFYRRTMRRCSGTCSIGFGTHFATPDVEIGENVYIGARCMIAHVRILDDVLIGSNVDLLSGKRQHFFERLDIPIRLQGGEDRVVTIGPDSWIGNSAVVAEDVGAQAVVAAGAVVVKPVAPRSIVGGNPARVLAERTTSTGDIGARQGSVVQG